MVAPTGVAAARFLSSPPNTVRSILLYGSDSFQISARAETLVRALSNKLGGEVQVIRLNDSELAADPDRLIVELATGSLFGGTKVVWLSSLPAKAHGSVMEIAAKPFDRAYLVVQAPDLKKSHKLVQAFEAAPFLAAIASYGEDRDALLATIREHFSSSGYEIEADAAALLAARTDFSAILARSEAQKLMTFAGKAQRRIAIREVEACLFDQQSAGLSEIVDHALNGEGRKAILAFERFSAVEQNVTPALAVLSSNLLRLHALRTAVDAGTSIAQAIKDLRPPVFFKQQDILAAQVRLWRVEALLALIGDLNNVLRETRLKPSLAEDLTANLLLRIATVARSPAAHRVSPL